ncbi:hypothetical protein SAMN05192574_104497 [Mucilaginibacter gossypiicola]|uniref:Uncharacterized protein n=1 Tax=Mucilaginibacter gossypiicola TaxID=551995 RepID=A0A1H8K9E8_9SPHI|nr:hypothetical protein SAMN05192574_104497 [Mucilaginibacter gossypiicola]
MMYKISPHSCYAIPPGSFVTFDFIDQFSLTRISPHNSSRESDLRDLLQLFYQHIKINTNNRDLFPWLGFSVFVKSAAIKQATGKANI